MDFTDDRTAIVEARRELIEEMLAGLPALIEAYDAYGARLRARLGVNGGQWELLREIDQQAPLGIADLARGRSVSRQYVHRLVDELVGARLVTLSTDPADRRIRLIEVTALARQRLDEAAAAERAAERALAAGFGTDELAVAVSVLARLAGGLSDSGSG